MGRVREKMWGELLNTYMECTHRKREPLALKGRKLESTSRTWQLAWNSLSIYIILTANFARLSIILSFTKCGFHTWAAYDFTALQVLEGLYWLKTDDTGDQKVSLLNGVPVYLKSRPQTLGIGHETPVPSCTGSVLRTWLISTQDNYCSGSLLVALNSSSLWLPYSCTWTHWIIKVGYYILFMSCWSWR